MRHYVCEREITSEGRQERKEISNGLSVLLVHIRKDNFVFFLYFLLAFIHIMSSLCTEFFQHFDYKMSYQNID